MERGTRNEAGMGDGRHIIIYSRTGRYRFSITMSSHEPLNKRQKRGDDQKVAEIIAYGGPMYDEATARKMLQEVLLISEDAQGELSAEALEDADLHFDPDKLDSLYYVDDDNFWGMDVTAMTYFAKKGDAKMCRYLISRGASTTKMDNRGGSFSMYEAAEEGHLDICKVLYENGAQNDIWKEHPIYGWTPFHDAVYNGHDEVVRWLVLQGALCADASSEEIDEDCIHPEDHVPNSSDRKRMASSYTRLVEWAEMVIQTHSAVVMFLVGTLPPAPDTVQSHTLQCLSGYPGVRKHIGDYVGLEVTKGKQLRILRNVVDVLPSFIRTYEE